jgi:hypothetical protein
VKKAQTLAYPQGGKGYVCVTGHKYEQTGVPEADLIFTLRSNRRSISPADRKD